MPTPTEVAMQSRRQFILKGAKLVAVGAAAASAGPSVFVRGAGAADKQLKVLQWAHFVPAYDKWFDPWAKEWGAKRGVEVTVDHVGFGDVVPRATAEVAAQSGHDVHMFIGLASAFEEHVIAVCDVGTISENQEAAQEVLTRRVSSSRDTKQQRTRARLSFRHPATSHTAV